MRFLAFLCALIGFSASAATLDLIGGSPAPLGAFPEIVYIRSVADGARCSATVVSPLGERGVILTAGHCVANQGEIGPVADEVSFEIADRAYRAVCEQHPDYARTKADSDMALCLVDGVLDVEPATISKVGPRVGDTVLLTGYGCVQPGGGGGNDKVLRIGKAVVTQAAGADSWFYTRARTGASAALCFGDSGSSAQTLPPAVGKGPKEEEEVVRHVVLGTNSRGDIFELSLIAGTFLPKAQEFLKGWASRKRVAVCGINQNC